MKRTKNAKQPSADSRLPVDLDAGKALTDVLGQTEHVKGLVEQSAQELSAVNTGLAQVMAQSQELPGVKLALEQSLAVENKVQEASEKLSVVNWALEAEVNARHVLEAQLATVTQDAQAARHAALHDALTGLPNRHERTLAVMFLDLDGFKGINDVYGHDVGDVVLQRTAERLKQHTRGDDTVSRFSGDEFLYLLTEIDGDHGTALVAQKLADAVQFPFQLSTGELTIKPSIGIAVFPRDGTTMSVLMKSADTAMYKAKQGKLVYAFAS